MLKQISGYLCLVVACLSVIACATHAQPKTKFSVEGTANPQVIIKESWHGNNLFGTTYINTKGLGGPDMITPSIMRVQVGEKRPGSKGPAFLYQLSFFSIDKSGAAIPTFSVSPNSVIPVGGSSPIKGVFWFAGGQTDELTEGAIISGRLQIYGDFQAAFSGSAYFASEQETTTYRKLNYAVTNKILRNGHTTALSQSDTARIVENIIQ